MKNQPQSLKYKSLAVDGRVDSLSWCICPGLRPGSHVL